MTAKRIQLVTNLSVFLLVSAIAGDKASPGLTVIQEWLVKLDNGEYERCWKDGAKLMHEVTSLDEWRDFLIKQSQVFGQRLDRKVVGTATHNRFRRADGTTIDGEFLEVEFKSAFEHRGLVLETISAMKEADGKWRVFAYDARPFAL
jgi:hypothetical protein